MTAKSRATRAGFTLVEVLMVIAIISILAALLFTAIGKVRETARVTTTANDITQLDAAIQKFKQDFTTLPPSHVTIPAGVDTTRPGNAGQPSSVYRFRLPTKSTDPEFAFLQRMFPRWAPLQSGDSAYGSTTDPRAAFQFQSDGVTLDLDRMMTFAPQPTPAVSPPVPPPAAPLAVLIRLTNPNAAGANPNAAPLDSNQALVLFLGGPTALLNDTTFPPLTTPVAFSLASYGGGWDVAGPTAPPAASTSKKGPHYDFPQAKLTTEIGGVPAGLLPRYVDAWGTPFAYFTSSSGDNYDPRVAFPWPAVSGNTDNPAPETYDAEAGTNIGTTASATGGGAPGVPGDPRNTTTFTAHPYRSNGKWLNPGRFQLLSAGRDRMFGPGSVKAPPGTPLNAATFPAVVDLWDAKNPQGNPKSAVYFGEGGGELFAGTAPANPKLSRGADDLCNFNGGNNLGTANAP